MLTTNTTPGAAAPTVDEQIGARLKVWRKRRGLSLDKLGQAVGVTYQQVQKYETGRNRLSSDTLIALCRVLECSPLSILPWNEDFEEAPADARLSDFEAIEKALNALDLSTPGGMAAREGMVRLLRAVE